MLSKNRAAIAGLASLLIIAIAGIWGYSAYQARERTRAVTAAIEDTTVRMRAALEVTPGARGRGSLAALERHAAVLDAHLDTVRKAAARGAAPLLDGAEHYILGAREILRRQIAGIRQWEETAASRAALAAHMRHAARRDRAWIRQALERKKRLETEYFDYNLTLGALQELLGSMPEARKRLAPHVDEALLLEAGSAEQARRVAAKEAKRVSEELERVRRLSPY